MENAISDIENLQTMTSDILIKIKNQIKKNQLELKIK